MKIALRTIGNKALTLAYTLKLVLLSLGTS
jgi:hypothetical protein